MSKVSLVLAATVLCSANMWAWGQPVSRPVAPDITRLERRLSTLQDQVQQQSRRLQAMAEGLEKQQAPAKPVGPSPAELEQRLNALQGQVEQLTGKLQQATERLDKQQAGPDPAQLEKRLNTLQEQVQQLSGKLQQATEKLGKRPSGPDPAQLEKRLNTLQEQVQQETRRLQQATEKLDEQAKRVAGFTASQQSARDAVDRQVREASPAGMIAAFFAKACPPGWQAADGSGQVPDLRNRFVRGVGDQVALGQFYPGTDFEVESSAACRTPTGCGGIDPRNWTFFMQKQRINLRRTDKGDFGWNSPMQDITPSAGKSGNFRPDNVGLLYCIKARS